MIKSILAKLESDDGYSFINVMIPLTEKLVLAVTTSKGIIFANEDFFTSVVIGGGLVGRLSFPSLQYDATFKEDALSLNTCKVLRYTLKAIERVSVDLHVNLENIVITAWDEQNMGYGHMKPVFLPIEEIIPK